MTCNIWKYTNNIASTIGSETLFPCARCTRSRIILCRAIRRARFSPPPLSLFPLIMHINSYKLWFAKFSSKPIGYKDHKLIDGTPIHIQILSVGLQSASTFIITFYLPRFRLSTSTEYTVYQHNILRNII